MIPFTILDQRYSPEALGLIPDFLSANNPASARDQFDYNYQHGGGWRPMRGWTYNPASNSIRYPGDPPLQPIARAMLRDEAIYIYPNAWVAIVQTDGSFEVARMD